MELVQLVLEQIIVYPQAAKLFATVENDLGLSKKKHIEYFSNIRNHVICVGGVCLALQEAFGTSVIFSFILGGDSSSWRAFLRNPISMLFKDGRIGALRGTHNFAAALVKDRDVTLASILSYVCGKFNKQILLGDSEDKVCFIY